MSKIWAKDLSIEALPEGHTSDDPLAMHVEYSLWGIAKEEWEAVHYEEGEEDKIACEFKGAPDDFDCLYLDCDDVDAFLCKKDFSEIVGCVEFPLFMFFKENNKIYMSAEVDSEAYILHQFDRFDIFSAKG